MPTYEVDFCYEIRMKQFVDARDHAHALEVVSNAAMATATIAAGGYATELNYMQFGHAEVTDESSRERQRWTGRLSGPFTLADPDRWTKLGDSSGAERQKGTSEKHGTRGTIST